MNRDKTAILRLQNFRTATVRNSDLKKKSAGLATVTLSSHTVLLTFSRQSVRLFLRPVSEADWGEGRGVDHSTDRGVARVKLGG